MRRREFDVPEVGTRFENVNGVKEAFGFAIDFSDDAGTRGFGAVALERALERDFLAGEKLFVDLQNAAVATDKKGLRENAAHYPDGVHPGGLERYAERDAIALAKDFAARGGHVRGKMHRLDASLASDLAGFWELENEIVVGSNIVRGASGVHGGTSVRVGP